MASASVKVTSEQFKRIANDYFYTNRPVDMESYFTVSAPPCRLAVYGCKGCVSAAKLVPAEPSVRSKKHRAKQGCWDGV